MTDIRLIHGTPLLTNLDITKHISSQSHVVIDLDDANKRTGRHFAGGMEKICPENNNFPCK